ncbi:MAG: 50S ribosomal protein L35 [Candidatus Margulisiibacteriota bacterium]|jgi:large subunit ribosomal protein L35
MPKMKTRKAAAKRFKVTGSGKFTRRKAKTKHLLGHESSKTKRNRAGSFVISKTDLNNVKDMLPYA